MSLVFGSAARSVNAVWAYTVPGNPEDGFGNDVLSTSGSKCTRTRSACASTTQWAAVMTTVAEISAPLHRTPVYEFPL